MTIRFHLVLASLGGSVIQVIGRSEFEDGLKIGNQSEARKGLQRFKTFYCCSCGVRCAGGNEYSIK